jgi:hypothetical protein
MPRAPKKPDLYKLLDGGLSSGTSDIKHLGDRQFSECTSRWNDASQDSPLHFNAQGVND